MSSRALSRSVRRASTMILGVTTALLVAGCSVTSVTSADGPAKHARNPSSPTVGTARTAATASMPVRPGELWIVHQEYDGEQVRLWLVRPDGTGDHELLPTFAGEAVHPDWSPDGRRVTFVSENDVYVVAARR